MPKPLHFCNVMMDEAQVWIRALIKCLPEAEKRLNVKPLLSDLHAEGILNDYEYADVTKDGINEIDRTRLVFHAAKRKDTEYMKKFVKLLDVPGTKQWADMIKREVEAFYQPSRDPDQTGQEDIDHPRKNVPKPKDKNVPKPKFAILTANDTEQNVVRRYLKLGESGRVWKGLEEYDWKCDPLLQKKKVRIELLEQTEDYEVFAIGEVTGVHVKCIRIGPGGAQKTTSAMLQKKWPLKVMFVVGCCGVSMSDAAKKKKKNWRGTVLLSDLVDNYLDSGKIEGGKVVPKHYPFTLSPTWRNNLSEVSIVRPDVQDERYRDIPCEKVDKYLSGPLVIKSEEEGNRFRGDSEMVGIEMEGTSVHNVVDYWPEQDKPEVTVVKGISDYGAKDKNEEGPSVVFGRETEKELEDRDRQEIATFHAITLVARCVANKAHLFQ